MKHFLTFFSIFLLSQYISQNENNGYIYKVVFDVGNNIRNEILQKDFSGYTGAVKTVKGEKVKITEKAVFDGNEVKRIMDAFCKILKENSKVDNVLYNELSKVKNGSTFAQASNSSTTATSYVFDFFPTVENLRSAIKKNYAEYYDIKIIIGGIIFSSDLADNYLSYQANVSVTAKGQDKKTKWVKKGIFADFSSIFKEGSLTKNNKRFKIKEKQTLTLEEIEKSAILAIKEIVES
jgi:ribosomal protein L21E